MKKKGEKIFILIGLLVTMTTIVFVFTFLQRNRNIKQINNAQVQSEKNESDFYVEKTKEEIVKSDTSTSTISVNLITGDKKTILEFKEGASFYDILNNAQEKDLVSFSAQKYSGLGFFITEINGLKNGNGKNLMYEINGKEATEGVSSYIPKDGDFIEWKLK